MKSILHKPQPKYSSDPIKIAAGTHLPLNEKSEQPSSRPGYGSIKRVGFDLSNEIKTPAESPQSPSRIPTINQTPSKLGGKVSYPELSAHKPHPLNSNPVTAGNFTFNLDSPIKFRSAPNTPAGNKPTVRCVRPSGVSTPAAPFENLPAVPHGMPNKKRRRPDDYEDVENQPPEEGSKRVKMYSSPIRGTQMQTPKSVKRMDAVEKRMDSASPKKKAVLSLSRLNALARPKHRA